MDELREAFKSSTTSGEEIDFDQLLASVDKDKNGRIEYQEFVDLMT